MGKWLLHVACCHIEVLVCCALAVMTLGIAGMCWEAGVVVMQPSWALDLGLVVM